MLEFKKENIKTIEFLTYVEGGLIRINFNNSYIMSGTNLYFDIDIMFLSFKHDLITKYDLDLIHEYGACQIYVPKEIKKGVSRYAN